VALPPVRSITLGVPGAHPLGRLAIERAAKDLHQAEEAFASAGYVVQTVRLSTRPVLEDMAGATPAVLASYAEELSGLLSEAGVAFCSLGPVPLEVAGERAGLVVGMVAGHEAVNCTVEVATAKRGVDVAAARAAAEVMGELARGTDQGLGNFNFAAVACMPPGAPFFPAAYHRGPAQLTVALQGASTVAAALAGGASLAEVTGRARLLLVERGAPVVALAQRVAAELGLAFGGIDLSPAPQGSDSIAAAMELAGLGRVGSPGTLALAGQLTAALRGTGLPTCGYCGLMLPVLEDAVLAQRWEEGLVGTDQLLAYSAVCGTGLDTVPLPGDATTDQMARLICDVATMSYRLGKPLSARLLPAPGRKAGQRTDFSSPYLTNTVIQALA